METIEIRKKYLKIKKIKKQIFPRKNQQRQGWFFIRLIKLINLVMAMKICLSDVPGGAML